MLLLWNIEKFTFQCRKFMVPCMDEKYYEHELDLKNYDLDSGYMLGINEDVLKVRHEKDKIIMTSLKESFRDWEAYRFIEKTDTSSHGYTCEMLSNSRKSSFFQNYRERQESSLGSRTELFWMVQSFEHNVYVELEKCEVLETPPESCLEGDMNPFLGNTVFPMETRKTLALYFTRKGQKKNFCEDMVRFFVSQIQLSGCGNRVSHCEIHDSDWQGIYVSGNEHLFEYNYIHDVTLNSNDTSPWYIGRDPSSRGNIVRYNRFERCGNPERMNMGIYCDDSSTDVLVYGNLFVDMNTTHGVMFSNTGWDLKFVNNIVVNPVASTMYISSHYYTWARDQGPACFGENGLLRYRLTQCVDIYSAPYSDRYPELMNYLDPIVEGQEWEGMRSRRNCMTRNLIVGSREAPLKLDGPHAQGTETNNFCTQDDPGFVDWKGGDYRLKPDAEAYRRIEGFEPLPIERMGVYEDEYRKTDNR